MDPVAGRITSFQTPAFGRPRSPRSTQAGRSVEIPRARRIGRAERVELRAAAARAAVAGSRPRGTGIGLEPFIAHTGEEKDLATRLVRAECGTARPG
jgi:hypothetical protein